MLVYQRVSASLVCLILYMYVKKTGGLHFKPSSHSARDALLVGVRTRMPWPCLAKLEEKIWWSSGEILGPVLVKFYGNPKMVLGAGGGNPNIHGNDQLVEIQTSSKTSPSE